MEIWVDKSIKCICGGKYSKSNKNRHFQCKKHLAFHICECGLSYTDKTKSRHEKMQQHLNFFKKTV